MTEKQRDTIGKLKHEIIRLREKNRLLREKYKLPKSKLVKTRRKEVPLEIITFNCGGCGRKVRSNEKHTSEDCKIYSQIHGIQSKTSTKLGTEESRI